MTAQKQIFYAAIHLDKAEYAEKAEH